MKNKKFIFTVWATMLTMLLLFSACGAPTLLIADDVTTYNSFAEFIPFIPGGFPDDFDLDGAKVGTFEQNEQAVYWEYYVGAEGRYFLTLQRTMKDNSLLNGETLTIQGWDARLGVLETMQDIPELADVEMGEMLVLSIAGRTKQGLPVLIEIVSNGSADELIAYGELIEPSICLSSPTPEG